MAKIGLNYGEKLQIADKTYRVITEGLTHTTFVANADVSLSTFISIERFNPWLVS